MRKFLIDVNVPRDIWILLKERKLPYQCLHDIDREMDDVDIVTMALAKNLVLITCDKDFMGLHKARQNLDIIIFDAFGQSVERKVFVLEQFLDILQRDPMMNIGCTILKC